MAYPHEGMQMAKDKIELFTAPKWQITAEWPLPVPVLEEQPYIQRIDNLPRVEKEAIAARMPEDVKLFLQQLKPFGLHQAVRYEDESCLD